MTIPGDPGMKQRSWWWGAIPTSHKVGLIAFAAILLCIMGSIALGSSTKNDAPSNTSIGTEKDVPSNVDALPSTQIPVPPPPAPALEPVTLSGKGEAVKTIELAKHGYTVMYQASSLCLIVKPVKADGSEGVSIINECGDWDTETVSGTTVYRANGPVTVHVFNTSEAWSLTFTPLN